MGYGPAMDDVQPEQPSDVFVVGVVAAPGDAADLATELAAELPVELAERFPGTRWEVDVRVAGPHDSAARVDDLVDTVRRHLLDAGWHLAVGLSDLPLHAAKRAVVAHSNATNGVGLVSIPALGAIKVRQRLVRAVVHVIEGMLGEAVSGGGIGDEPRRVQRMLDRLGELRSPLGIVRAADDGSVRFIGAVVRGNLRLLVGMVHANHPTRVIARLSRATVGALAAGTAAVVLRDIWLLADSTSFLRLAALAATGIAITVFALLVAHGLWERARSAHARERVVLTNAATAITITLGVLALFVALVALFAAGAALLIPSARLAHELGHGVDVVDYLRLASYVAVLATVGGALGSLVESDPAVRNATHLQRADARTERHGAERHGAALDTD
ncbi:MAG: hypothetical protein JWM25_1184 [Thermoleophilia bacterium]|nr:hypothetical protein [Thermoleophilia bacterium]